MCSFRLNAFDQSNVHYYSHLTLNDNCWYLGEYIARGGFKAGPVNNMIDNLKKPVNSHPNIRTHKKMAICGVARLITASLPSELNNATFVPIPCSKEKTDPLYDNRLTQILKIVQKTSNLNIDVRELVKRKISREPLHFSGSNRRTPEDQLEELEIERDLLSPPPSKICIFDDVITSGASFKAMKILINGIFSNVPVYGLFISRNVGASEKQDRQYSSIFAEEDA